ncbi:hypothetical protein GEV43_28960 [Actinomadura sp. J1-007]|nr:hypothetical protein [Actinomadura sp. J1-007]
MGVRHGLRRRQDRGAGALRGGRRGPGGRAGRDRRGGGPGGPGGAPVRRAAGARGGGSRGAVARSQGLRSRAGGRLRAPSPDQARPGAAAARRPVAGAQRGRTRPRGDDRGSRACMTWPSYC